MRTIASPPGLPATWSPMGKEPELKPQGTETAGVLERLKVLVRM